MTLLGALTIANDAVQASMLNDDIICGRKESWWCKDNQGDEFIFSVGTITKVTFVI